MSALTWDKLAKTDDFLTANLVDNLDFWIKTRKVSGFDDSMSIHKHIIYKILKRYIINTKKVNVRKCLIHIAAQKETKAFLEKYLSSSKEFKKYASRYVNLFALDCGFQIMATDRYKIKTNNYESCVVARKQFEPNDEIKYLIGSFADLDEKAEESLDKNDFSVFNTASRKSSKLMLGPARFVNHDCEGNAKFSPHSSTGIKIIATKVILSGEEITVRYAPNYFGSNNKDCLCATCERTKQGYFHPNRADIPSDAEYQDISSDDDVESSDEVERLDYIPELESIKKKNRRNAEHIVIEISSDDDGEVISEEDSFSREESANITDDSEGEEHSSTATLIPRSRKNYLLDSLRTDDKFGKKFDESSDRVIGGRHLRARDKVRNYYASHRGNGIITTLPEDLSFDSLSLSGLGKNESLMEERQIQRQLNKLYMCELYKESADLDNVYDCLNCGVYFKFEKPCKFKEYCPSCVRHQKLYRLAWPDTKIHSYSSSLNLDPYTIRPSIGDLKKSHRFRARQAPLLSKASVSKKSTPDSSPPELHGSIKVQKMLLSRNRTSFPAIKHPYDTLNQLKQNVKSPRAINRGEEDIKFKYDLKQNQTLKKTGLAGKFTNYGDEGNDNEIEQTKDNSNNKYANTSTTKREFITQKIDLISLRTKKGIKRDIKGDTKIVRKDGTALFEAISKTKTETKCIWKDATKKLMATTKKEIQDNELEDNSDDEVDLLRVEIYREVPDSDSESGIEMRKADIFDLDKNSDYDMQASTEETNDLNSELNDFVHIVKAEKKKKKRRKNINPMKFIQRA